MLRGHTFIGGFSQGPSKMIGASKRLRISAYLSASFLLIFGLLAVFPVANSISNTNAAKKDLGQTTLAMTSSNFYANPKVTSANGTFSSTSTDITVSTDNYTGYTIGVAAATDDSDYSKLKSTDSELNSISSATSEADFSAAAGTSYNGLWGYKPSMLGSSSNTNYLPAPTFAGDELNKTNSPNEQADTYTISLGARADASTPYGRYENSFVIRTVANPIGVSFNYNKNTEDTVTNMPANIAASLSDEKIVVSDTVPVRSGYELTGWCDGATKRVLDIDYCDDEKKYDGGDDYYLDRSGATATVELFAMWKPSSANDFVCNPLATTISEAVCMQDMNESVKASMTAEQQYRLYDNRDGKRYYVSKLADGNVWMTQNLDFVLNASMTLTHADTDLGWTKNDATATWSPANDTLLDETLWPNSDAEAQSLKLTNRYYVPSNTKSIDKSYETLEECESVTGSKADCEHRQTGMIYNWTAAVATDNPSAEELNGNGTIAPDSICPAGWRLPYGARSGISSADHASDYGRLMYAYEFLPDPSANNYGGRPDTTIGQIGSSPLYFVRTGYIYGGDYGFEYKGEYGYYWSSTNAISGTSSGVNVFNYYASTYNANSGQISTEGYWSKYYGMPIRCVARNSATISFDANGGEGTMAPMTIYGDVHLPENQFTKTDKSFVGWNTEADGSGTGYNLGYASSLFYPLRDNPDDVTLYAQWEDKTSVSYDGNGADSGSVSTQYVDYMKKVTIAENGFTRDGYAFNGWNTEADGSGVDYNPGEEFTATEIAGEDVTLYAKWRERTLHTVNYKANGNTNSVVYSCVGGKYTVTKYSHTQNIDDTGLKQSNYGGSWTEANITGTDRGDTSKAHVVTIPGATSINVKIYYNGENTSYDWVSVWRGSHPEYTASKDYGSAGYVWQKLGGSQSSTYTVNGNSLTKMGYSSTTISGDTVTFGFRSDSGGYGQGYGYYAIITGTANDFSCEATEGTYEDAEDTENGGFLGWNTYNTYNYATYKNEEEVLYNYVQTRMESSYTTTDVFAGYGRWTNIVFDANDDSGNTETQGIAYSKTVDLRKNTFTREGYDFYAWNEKSDGSGTYHYDGEPWPATSSSATTITLYAQWTPKAEYTVNYHNGEDVNTVKYNCWDGRYLNKKIAHSPNVDDSGTKVSELNTYYVSNSTVITIPNATKLHVKLTYGSTSINYGYAVIWKGNMGTSYSSSSYYSYGVKLGDNTTGKYGGTGPEGENLVVEGDIDGDTITVGFYNSYNGTNYANGYGYYLEVTVDQGTMLCDEQPTQGQYVAPTGEEDDVFTGWTFDSTASLGSYMNESETKAALTTDSTTVDAYAIWAKPTIVRFDSNGGNGTMDDVLLKYGETLAMPQATFTNDDDGADFYQWNTAADNSGTSYGKNNPFTATNPAGEIYTVYEIWWMPTYWHLDANGGTGEEMPVIKATRRGSCGRVPGASSYTYTMENASIHHWNTMPDNSGSNKWTNDSLCTDGIAGGDRYIYAIWGHDTIIHFNANGGLGEMADFHAPYGTSSYLPDVAFGRSGAKFDKWNTAADESGTAYNNKGYFYPDNMEGGEITLYAIWGWPATLHFEPNGGEGEMEDMYVPYDQDINLPAVGFSKEGTVFAYWNTAADHTGQRYDNESKYNSHNTEYVGTLYLYAIWGYPTYFNYYANGGEGSMETKRIDWDNDFALDANTFTKSGMKFVGWNTSPDGTGRSFTNQQVYHTDNVDGETLNLYAMWAPESSPVIPEYIDETTNKPGVTIARAYEIAYSAAHKGMYEEQHDGQGDYALVDSWNGESYKGYDVRFAMQDMTRAICDSVTVTWDDYQALDVRDNKLYHITKMIDGSCWMTQNLDYNFQSDGNGGVVPLTSETSDLNLYNTNQYNASTGYSYNNGVISWTPSIATTNAANVTNNRIYGIYENFSLNDTEDTTMKKPFSVDVGNWYWNPHYNDLHESTYVQSSTTNSRVFLDSSKTSDYFQKNVAYESNGEHGHVGNYYNWAAAVATNDGQSFDYNSVAEWNWETEEWEQTYELNLNAKNSICPKGWRLPREDYTMNGADLGDNRSLIKAEDRAGRWFNYNYNMYSEPYYVVRAGIIWPGSTDKQYASMYESDYYGALFTSESGHVYQKINDSTFSTHWPDHLLWLEGNDTKLSTVHSNTGGGLNSVRCIAR